MARVRPYSRPAAVAAAAWPGRGDSRGDRVRPIQPASEHDAAKTDVKRGATAISRTLTGAEMDR